jgi:hypothetical protein
MPRTQITRDDRELGFETGRVPAITEQQFRWLSFRMGCDDDLEPCRIMELDPLKLRDWLENPDFIEVYGKITENKREAFKYLITQLNGKALRVINDLLDETSVSARVNGLNLLLRAEGLLIDKTRTVDIDSITRLMQALNTPYIEGQVRELPSASESPSEPRASQ